jgi:hypothetical protein
MQREGLLRELCQLVRYAEPDGHNAGFFVAEHAPALAQLLQSDEGELDGLVGVRDGEVVDRLRARIDLALDDERDVRHQQAVERAYRAARAIERTARTFERGVVLDVDLVLGDLLVMPKCRSIAFQLGDVVRLVPTELLRRARLLRRTWLDVACFMDDRGISFRWKGGRGALNFYGKEPDGRTAHDALVVELPAFQPEERRPVLIGDVLAEMGFGP